MKVFTDPIYRAVSGIGRKSTDKKDHYPLRELTYQMDTLHFGGASVGKEQPQTTHAMDRSHTVHMFA